MIVQKVFLLLAMVLGVCSLHAQEEDRTQYSPVQYPEGYTAQLNVVYTEVNGWQGLMDLYLLINAKSPVPLVINIHGGGWNHGVKESQTGYSTFFKAGFAVANIEYRLTGQATAPAAVEDTRCALIYLIKNAKALNIDPERIVIMGGSAGGHLALMGGLLANDPLFDGNCTGTENIKVAAIINKYGITDVWDWGYGNNIRSKSATRWLGDKANDKDFAASVSPVTYVNKNSPPVFIVHGDADPTVPYQQSVELHKQLKAAGVQTEFITVPGGGHGKFEKEQNTMVNKAILQFLKSVPALKLS